MASSCGDICLGWDINIYVDGILAGVGTAAAFNFNGTSLFLGKAPQLPWINFTGALDKVSVFNKALTAVQVASLPTQTPAQLVSLGLVGLYKGEGNALDSGPASPADNGILNGFFTFPGSIYGVDPLLGPLANNGGPTQTMSPLPGSPAIDAGTNMAVATDQRGLSRVVRTRK